MKKSSKDRERLRIGRPLEQFSWERTYARFIDKIHRTRACWLWTGSLTGIGYGQFFVHRKRVDAHRASWFLHYGAIPRGLLVRHRCDTKACVNPKHLELGTHADNIDDRRRRNSSSFKHGKLTREQILEIRALYRYRSREFNLESLGLRYHVTPSCIGYVVRGDTW